MAKKIEKNNVCDIFELNAVQKGILFESLRETAQNLYCIQLSFSIEGVFDPAVLQRCFELVQKDNEVLRSVFRWENLGKPVQVILEKCPIGFSYSEITAPENGDEADIIKSFSVGKWRMGFDLTELPFRVAVLKISERSFILNITYHHILFDGWSNGILLKELFSCYRELSLGRVPLTMAKPGYKEVYEALRARPAESRGETYWRDYLAGCSLTLLTARRRRKPIGERPVRKLVFNASAARLRAFAAEHKVTQAAVLYTVYGLLLQKILKTPDVVFGITVSDRKDPIPGIDSTIGNFINTIPLRCRGIAEGTLLDCVRHVHHNTIEINRFTGTSYWDIRQLLNLAPGAPLYDSVVAVENYPVDNAAINCNEGFTVALNSVYENASIPLVVTILFNSLLEIEFAYRDGLFTKEDIQKLGDGFISILDALLDDCHSKVSDLPALMESNNEPENIVDLFLRQAVRTPEAIALQTGLATITYSKLNDSADRFAAFLREIYKVSTGDLVGLMLERDEHLVIAILGVLRSGAAYIPIDTAYPKDRVLSILADSKLKVVITFGKYRQVFDEAGVEVIGLDREINRIYSLAPAAGDSPAASDLAYVIYTSGSTGKPKGVMIEHQSLAHYISWAAGQYVRNERGNFPLFTSIAFDLTVTSIFVPLVTGNTVIIYRDGEIGAILEEIISNPEVDIIKLTPSHLKIMRDMGIGTPAGERLRKLIVGGEDLPARLARDMHELFNGRVGIYNEYGPTEATVGCMIYQYDPGITSASVPIGCAIPGMHIYLLDEELKPVRRGADGEIFIAGPALARGYLNNSELTDLKFIDNSFEDGEGKLYRTGDIATSDQNGVLTYKGRVDDQVKIRGFRIEIREIEARLAEHEGIGEAAIVLREEAGGKQLVAYYVVSGNDPGPDTLRAYLAQRLPAPMIPAYYIRLEAMPLTVNGKTDKKNLSTLAPQIPVDQHPEDATGEVEKTLVKLWSEVLGHEKISIHQNFFDIGGDSMKVISLAGKINRAFKIRIAINDLFGYPTISRFADFIRHKDRPIAQPGGPGRGQPVNADRAVRESDIAVIGMAARMPGAPNIHVFWENLRQGKESITHRENIDPNDHKVYAKGFLEDCEMFDAAFFGYIPAEAENMDPQIRIFHECTWEALENAGYDPMNYTGSIGLYGGASPNPYYNLNIRTQEDDDFFEKWASLAYADKDFMCPRVSYKLNLRGPSVNIATACSTSLVAVDTACQELSAGKCDMAVAGGVSVTLHEDNGYVYHKGMILSPDGRCRAFDKDSAGTVGGNGAGAVVLKRLSDALRDGDSIHAIIRGSATNNDGNAKVGFTAPGIEGQCTVIRMALKKAGVEAESISYIEAHGTGTALGDPIEIAALTKAFHTEKRQFCALGSVKTNIGHLDAAAGVAGLIKTVLALKYRYLPPSLHYKSANPAIDFQNSPFYVNAAPSAWEIRDYPRRAGVSSFGIGGTNAHVILEEAADGEKTSDSNEFHLFLLSAKTPYSLDGNISRLRNYLESEPVPALSDIAYTLQVGRAHFPYRKMIACKDRSEAIELLSAGAGMEMQPLDLEQERPLVFMFSGQGSQYVNMYSDLYTGEPRFKETADQCFEIVQRISGKDLRSVLFTEDQHELNNTRNAQPILFILEYALAKLLTGWGIQPAIMIGHSIGEYVAACLSGVFSLEDALLLVVKRGELMQRAPEGAMLSISVSEERLAPILKEVPGACLAAVNSSGFCVASGPRKKIEELREIISGLGYDNKLLHTSHAFHSDMMDVILPEFREIVAGIRIGTPKIPYVSNLHGELVSEGELSSPEYWANHLRQEVRFAAGIETILSLFKAALFVEIGPGNALTTLVRTHRSRRKVNKVIALVRRHDEHLNDARYLLSHLGELWLNGITIDWSAYHGKEKRRRVALPGYCFERVRYPMKLDALTGSDVAGRATRAFPDLLNIPSWELSDTIAQRTDIPGSACNLVFSDDGFVGKALMERFGQTGEETILVQKGQTFQRHNRSFFSVNPEMEADFARLLSAIGRWDSYRIIFIWGLCVERDAAVTPGSINGALENYYSLLSIARAIGGADQVRHAEITAIANDVYPVLQGDRIAPGKSIITAALKVIPKEYGHFHCNLIDVVLEEVDQPFLDAIFQDIRSGRRNDIAAYRKRTRFSPTVRPVSLPDERKVAIPFVPHGVYLVTGGSGGMGLSFMKRMARQVEGICFIVLGRRPLHDVRDAFRAIEEAGANIDYQSVDITDKAALQDVIDRAQDQWGRIRGVIHAAGVGDYAGLIYKRTRPDDAPIFAPKIYGTVLIYDILSVNQLDFFILCSSLATVEAPPGQVGYVAANLFLDSFACYSRAIKGIPVTSIAWNAWKEVGMAVEAGKRVPGFDNSVNSVTPDEGYDMLLRSIGSGLPVVIISTGHSAGIGKHANRVTEPPAGQNAAARTIQAGNASIQVYEETLLELWKSFFSSPSITVDDDFFEIGGDSLKALRMINKIYKALDIELSITDFFATPTIRELGKRISALNGEKFGAAGYRAIEYSPIPAAEKKAYYPLSSGQKGLYFIYDYNRSSIAYNMPLTLALQGKTDIPRVEQAFRKLIDRHESLRTCFEIIGDMPYQRISEECRFELERHIADGDAREILRDFIRPFDLRHAPLIRAGIITLSENEHILMVDLHHIITDGTSKSLLIRDFVALYNNEELLPLPVRYKDYSEWQQRDAWRQLIGKQKDFWLREFAEPAPLLELPADFIRPEVKSYRGHYLRFAIGPEETSRLRAFAEAEGATIFMVVLAVYTVLLAKAGGQEDIVVGIPVAGRQHSDLDGVVGLFVNILPLRNFPGKDLSFREFLQSIKAKALACFGNQGYPYEELVNELNIRRHASRNPLFDTVLFYQNFQQNEVAIRDLVVRPYPDQYSVIDYDLNLVVYERDSGLDMQIEYSIDLFKEERVARLAGQLMRIVHEVLGNPVVRIADIQTLEAEENALLRQGVNGIRRPLDKHRLFPQLFRKQVIETPGAVAVMHNGEELTYQELFMEMSGLASLLYARGVRKGHRVALYLPRSIEMLSAMLACLEVGAAYIPLDTGHPVGRTRQILLDSEPEVILFTENETPEVEELITGMDIITEAICTKRPAAVSEAGMRPLGEPGGNADDVRPDADDPAYIIYTSGTTGKPKGVVIHHLGMLNHLLAKINDLALGGDDTVAQTASAAFDISVWQFLAALPVGGKTCIIDKDMVLDPPVLFGELKRSGVSIFESVPSLLIAFLEGLGNTAAGHLLRLRWMIPTGEPLGAVLVRRWYSYFPGIPLLNVYGPTEASDDVTHYIVRCPGSETEVIPVGKPIQNVRIYILDRSLGLCPTGAKGEICIAGPCVGKGYWRDQERTDRAFVPNPYAREEEPDFNRLYKTGDIGYCREDGNIICLGRMDEQVKIRGNRVELGEVQALLSANPSIRECAVIAGEKKDNSYLVAYYVSDTEIDAEELKEYLVSRLPDYMVPAYYTRLNKMPVTGNGKLDKKALPEPVVATESEYAAPRTKEERMLADVWSKVLGVENIGIFDNLFSVGGDSIKSIQISSRMRSAGYEVSVKDIFDSPTIRQLASKIRKTVAEPDQSVITGRSSLTPIQQLYWEASDVDRHHFNQSVVLVFKTGISLNATRRIFRQLQAHHDALRMVFKDEQGIVFQENRGLDLPLALEEYDLRPETDPEETMSGIARNIQARTDLSTGPLMKVGLFQVPLGSRVLVVVHHLVMDGISWRILFGDIEQLYQQIQADEPLRLPHKTDPFLSWAGRLAEYARGKAFREAKTYWDADSNRKMDWTIRDIPDGRHLILDNVEERFSLEREETAKILTEVHRAFGTGMNDILLAGLLISIYRMFGHDHVRLDVEGHGREPVMEGINISRTIGWFTSLYTIFLQLGSEDLSGIIKQVKETLRHVPNNGIDYLLYRYLPDQPPPDEGRHFAIFNYLGQFDADVAGNSFLVTQENRGEEVSALKTRKYDWEIWGMVTEGRLTISLTYSQGQYYSGTMRRFMQEYKVILSELIDFCCLYDGAGLTPSDLGYHLLSIPEVDALQVQYALQDIYPLSPMQEGMLFHSLAEPRSGNYFEQMTFKMQGALDKEVVQKTLNDLSQRYTVLRTIFLFKDRPRPLQLVLRKRDVDFSFKDIRGECENTPAIQVFECCRLVDKARGFDPGSDALLRVSMLRTAEDEYMFIWSHHHILMDGWCVGILIKEFREIFSANKRGVKHHLPAVNPYSKYIKWLEERDAKAGNDYWAKYLASYGGLATLPKKEIRQSLQSARINEVVTLKLDNPEMRRLMELSRIYGVTLNTIIQTAWGVLLGRYNQTRDVVFGSVVSGRPAELSDVENMVGLFINTVPVRISYDEDETIGKLLQNVQRKALESDLYQYHSLAEIQTLSPLGNLLLDHLVIFLNYPIAGEIEKPAGQDQGNADYIISDVRMYEQTNYDLLLLVVPGEETTIKFEYNSLAFTEGTIKDIVTCFHNLIRQFIPGSERRIADLELLPGSRVGEIRDGFNHLLKHDPTVVSVIDLFEEQVRMNPDNPAVSFGENMLTYRQLKGKADGMAAYLEKVSDVRAGNMVAILLDRDEFLVPCILAILKTGSAYIPIDPEYPEERIQAILNGSRAKFLITRRRDITVGPGIQRIDPDRILAGIEPCPGHIPGKVKGSDLAYVIYTSGSTGTPKGVMIEHRSLSNYITWAADNYIGDFKAVFPLYTSISFDLTVTSIFVPLVTGNQLIVYGGSNMGTAIEEVMAEKKANVIKLTPSHLRLIRNSRSFPGGPGRGRIKFIVGGEDLEYDLANSIYESLGGNVEIYNEYGPTEATVGCMIHAFRPGEKGSSVPIGIPAKRTRIYLLDHSLKPVPEGMAGEIYIAGDGLARGYLFDAQLTAEKFIEDPFSPGERMYKTDDIATYHTGQGLIFRGRKDEQVKLRGFRIELGEISGYLSKHPDIRDAVVVMVDREGDKCLVAYYTAESEVGVAALKSYIMENVPRYMVPSFFVRLERLPVTANGKLDRKALPDPQPDAADASPAPSGETEGKLAQIWSGILKVDTAHIGVNRSFFDLGGHSLKATLLANQIFGEFGVEVSLRELFTHHTVREQAWLISRCAKSAFSHIEKSETKEYYVQSSSQKRLYFLYEFDKLSLAYNLPRAVSLEGYLDTARLKEAFMAVIRRHEILRTSFHLLDGMPMQKVHDEADFGTEYFQAQESAAGAILKDFVRPFDLSRAPLIRIGLIATGPGNHILLMDMHHIITDGMSEQLLVSDIIRFYRGEQLPAMRLQYKDYCEWRQREDGLRHIAGLKDFWIRELAEPAILELPTDFARPAVKTYAGSSINFVPGEAEVEALNKIAAGERATLFMCLLAVYAVFLNKVSNKEDIVIGTPAAGRGHADLENMMGVFVNTLPLRCYPRGGLTFREFLAAVRERTISCFENQAYPYEQLIDELKTIRDTGRNPLFDVMFMYQNLDHEAFDMPFVRLKTMEWESSMSKFDLTLVATESDHGLRFSFEYSTDLFKRDTVRRFAGYFQRIITAVAADPNVRLSDIGVMAGEERDSILHIFNDTYFPYPIENTIVSLFRDQVGRTPAETAVICKGEAMNYRELDELSDRIAFYLRRVKGIGSGDPVGLMLERDKYLLPAILGILKAGAAYVPLDPEYPVDRIRYVIEDSGLDCVLTCTSLLTVGGTLSGVSRIDVTALDLSAEYAGDLLPGVVQSDLAYIIYTSGSSGTPKGVPISHRNVVNFSYGIDRAIGFDAGLAILGLTTVSFDIFVLEAIVPLLKGMKVVLVGSGNQRNPEALFRLTRRERVDYLQMTPSHLKLLLANRNGDNFLSGVRCLMVGGEAFPPELLRDLKTIYGGRIYNMYGPTETTVWSAVGDLTAGGPICIGKPILNTVLRILDMHHRIVPIGVCGEICIGGDGVSGGYWKREPLTRQRFIADPEKPDQVIYRTGDLGRWLPDGNIEFLGRTDDQVKIRGYRIEPGEIEQRLLTHAAIREALVIAKETGGEKYLAAYYVALTEIKAAELRSHLAGKLPEYMLPSYFIPLQSIPLTPNGKVDRKALPDPAVTADDSYIPPSGKIEHKLTELWSDILLLDKDRISVEKSFFELGGNSLHAITLIARVQKEFDVSIQLVSFFKKPTIAEMGKDITMARLAGKMVQSGDKLTI